MYFLYVKIRHFLYDIGAIGSVEFDIPVICVGNITVGGTGKTPMVELILQYHMSTYNVAILSRGYGRSSKGYIEVKCEHDYRKVGDEPLQIKRKFPNAVVVVCEDRVEGVERLRKSHPEINMVIMDDGFQHRRITPKINVIIIDATRPVHHDHALPLGSLRDTPSSLDRANIFIVSKCPEGMTSIDRRVLQNNLISKAYQRIYFTRYESLTPEPLYPDIADSTMIFDHNTEVIAVAGIGNPTPFVESLDGQYKKVDQILFKDHHVYHMSDIKQMQSMTDRYPEAIIVMTEKDAVKLMGKSTIPAELRGKLYYMPIDISFLVEDSKNAFLNHLSYEIKHS